MAGLPPGRSEVLAYKQVFPDAAVQCAAASAAPRAARARVPDARMNGRTPAIADASTRQTRTRSTHARTGTIQRTRTSANRLCECFTDQKLIVTSTCQRRNNDRARIQMTRMNIATRQMLSYDHHAGAAPILAAMPRGTPRRPSRARTNAPRSPAAHGGARQHSTL